MDERREGAHAMPSMTFKIRGLDCAEEVTVLQRAVGPVMGGEAHLAFDILNGTMTVDLAQETVSEAAVRQAVARTGIQALPWQEASATPRAETAWQRHGRTILCVASGLLLASGFLWHAMRHGSVLDTLAAGDSGGHTFPLVSILLYLGAVVSGAWFIAPKALYAVHDVLARVHECVTRDFTIAHATVQVESQGYGEHETHL